MIRTGKAGAVLTQLSGLLASEGRFGPIHSLHLEALVALGRTKEALIALEQAIDRAGSDADAYDALAFFARQLGRHEISNRLYREATELRPSDAQLWYNLATSERSLGAVAAAARACERSLEQDPELRPAVLLRSELSRATPERNNVEDIKARLARVRREVDAMFLAYALGKELHELGRFDEAFAAFCQGASIRRKSLRYDVGVDERKLAAIASAYDDPGGAPSASGGRQIFIVGLPRSGTTLTERILGGLPHVRSNNETDNFSAALLAHTPSAGGTVFERTAKADYASVAAEYDRLSGADEHDDHIIEKLPFNYLYIGAILRTFSDVSVVWVRRNPLDSCFAMFRTLFGSAYPFTYDFEDLARYYAAYDRLMAHWQQLYPGRIVTVDYESLVTDPSAAGRELASGCGLRWEETATDIRRNKSASLTASASQVREGIYSSSMNMWLNYAELLEPLRTKLEERGIRTGKE